jgi:hypothetical protein
MERTAAQDLRRYLVEITKFKARLRLTPEGFNYSGGEDFVLDRGVPLDSEPLTDKERDLVLGAARRYGHRFQQGYCFHNAQMLVLHDHTGTLQYCEGYALGTVPLALLHGWVLINDKVVDLTWRTVSRRGKGTFRDRVLGVLPPGFAYYGVRFSRESIDIRVTRMGATASILDDLTNEFAIFREPRIRELDDILREHG